ncbi:hypothetical protein TrLO_g15391 [Triparma laevis f. longispina]|uniref:Uncharacterized protein n=1 Tax=Triparma laevis f. longispina TaxID=1714387 RepID=A0A9W7CIR4_9STRA|nr:hypothetical protein TrLO_g15391 [Triparma laevis f. longispina]
MEIASTPVKAFNKATNYLPISRLTTINRINSTRYSFKIFAPPSQIPNSGNGAFITLEKVETIKDVDYVYTGQKEQVGVFDSFVNKVPGVEEKDRTPLRSLHKEEIE